LRSDPRYVDLERRVGVPLLEDVGRRRALIATESSSLRMFMKRSLIRPSSSSETMAGVLTDVSIQPAGSVT